MEGQHTYGPTLRSSDNPLTCGRDRGSVHDHPNVPKSNLLFVGDVVGDAGIELLERHLPRLRREHALDAVIVNGENASITGPSPVGGCGITPEAAARLFAIDVDVVTGGNHSWDGPRAAETLALPRVLRPLNMGDGAPGVGATMFEKDGIRIGVINLASRTALPWADMPHDTLDAQLIAWEGHVDHVIVDLHGESVSEKQILAWSMAGRVSAVLGTHTHVPTLDARLLPGGTAFVSDVGMTGPSDGMQGYRPQPFIEAIRRRLPARGPAAFADGPAQLGAVLLSLGPTGAERISRVAPFEFDPRSAAPLVSPLEVDR